MPSRRRHRSTPTPPTAPRPASSPPAGKAAPADPTDALERFAAALKESERRDKADREKAAKAKAEADRRAADAAAQASAVRDAQRELDRAIAAVRAAKAAGKGTVEADARWKAAKARLIELETGAKPAWAPKETDAAQEPAEPAVADQAPEPDTD